ncbi:MAG: hypothetical protein ACFN40_05720 [Bacteroidota bacterium]|jgi:hypothetical protein
MKRLSYLFTILFCSILFASCGSINKNLKEEMQKIKEQCPIDMGQGIVMTNVDFYEGEKILEYVISIDGVESIDQDGVQQMKEVIVEELANNSSFLSNVSVKMILKQGYRFRYIYTDVAGNKLAEIIINDSDLP